MSKTKVDDSPALKFRSTDYPWGDRVPISVRMRQDVISYQEAAKAHGIAIWKALTGEKPLFAKTGEVYPCWVNSYGAVAVIIEGDMLGIKPGEFEVVEWETVPTMKAYRIDTPGFETGVVIANSRGRAAYRAHKGAKAAGYKIPLFRFRARRAPEFDSCRVLRDYDGVYILSYAEKLISRKYEQQ